ncbi:MAG: leucine-rich repeat domain-containing protein [Ruminococcaceae bacterium]|nr:leucine-rich repeat domain-containing protein [Oscillospiraceae bacterium]
MKKRALALLSLLLCLILVLSSCNIFGSDKDEKESEDEGTEGLEYQKLDDGTYAVVAIDDEDVKTITIPKKYKKKAVTQIAPSAFEGLEKLKKVTIPDSVTYIGDSAFKDCPNLKDVSLSKNLAGIGNNVFDGCYSLAYNEYDHALYLGNKSNPYVLLIMVSDMSASICEVHQDTKVICSTAFRSCYDLYEITYHGSLDQIVALFNNVIIANDGLEFNCNDGIFEWEDIFSGIDTNEETTGANVAPGELNYYDYYGKVITIYNDTILYYGNGSEYWNVGYGYILDIVGVSDDNEWGKVFCDNDYYYVPLALITDYDDGETTETTETTGTDEREYEFVVETQSVDENGNSVEILISTNDNVNSSCSYMMVEAPYDGYLRFDYKVISESSYDVFYVIHNGMTVLRHSGEDYNYQWFELEVEEGDTIEFKYEKDGSNSYGADCARIKGLRFDEYGESTVETDTTDSTETIAPDDNWGYEYGFEQDESVSADVLVSNNQGISGSTAYYRVVAPTYGRYTFYYRVSSESGWDQFWACVNSSSDRLFYCSGETSYEMCTVIVYEGDVLEFFYSKDSSGDSGNDQAYISGLTFEELDESNPYGYGFDETMGTNDNGDTVEILVSNNKGVDNSTAYYTVTATDFGYLVFDYLVSSDSCDYFEVYVNDYCELSRSGSNDSYVNAKIKVYKGDVIEFKYIKDYSNSYENDCAYIRDLHFEEYVSDSGYSFDTSVEYDDYNNPVDVLTSNNQYVEYTKAYYHVVATADGHYTFQYRTSSESGCDMLYVYKNGEVLISCSGDTAYQTYDIAVNAGDVIEFEYSKDSSVSSYNDTAYIKGLTFVPPAE